MLQYAKRVRAILLDALSEFEYASRISQEPGIETEFHLTRNPELETRNSKLLIGWSSEPATQPPQSSRSSLGSSRKEPYHPTNDKIALDFKANGFPFALVKVNGKPIIQGPNDPAPGFFVSTTSLEDTTKAETDPRRYVDSETISYIVLPPALVGSGKARLGDFAVVIDRKNGKSSFAIFADIGPKKNLGEGSIALAKALELKKDPKHGGPVADLIYIVFPGSNPDHRPKSQEEINTRGAEAFALWGGVDQVNACFGDD